MTNTEIIATIRNEIERLMCPEIQYSMEQLLSFLSTLESEKPMDIDFEQELYKHFGQVKDFTLGMRIGKYFYELGKQSGSSEIPNDLKKAADKYIYKAADSPGDNWTTDDIRNAYIAGYKEHAKNSDEKPVPSDLEEAAKEYAGDSVSDEGIMEVAAFIAGAKWQKQHDAELIEIAYNDGITIGMTKQKEQMLKEAVAEVEVGMRGDPIEIILDKYVQRAMGIFPRDKVRIIICKKED